MGSFCAYYNRSLCRSCAWIEFPYPEQILKKEQAIYEGLCFLNPFTLEKSTVSKEQAFRNRAKFSVTGTTENPIIGLTGDATQLDQGQELLQCPIHHPSINAVATQLPDFIRRFNLIPYSIKERRGELKGLIFYHSQTSDQMYLRFVLRSKECVSRIRKMLPELQLKFPFLVCVSANIQPVSHAILEGLEEIILTEKSYIDYRIGRVTLKLTPQAFVQTHEQVAAQLYETAAKWICETESQKMLDLYCGQGAFSFMAASQESGPTECWGVDIRAEGVRSANETAKELGFENIHFVCADATQVEEKIRATQPDLILVNPPRKGLGSGVEHFKSYAPKNLIYSSCSIESLAKDLRTLAPLYRLKRAQLFDLFPHTEHFEILVSLERRASGTY